MRVVADHALETAAAPSLAALARGDGDAYDHAMVALLRSEQGDYAAADQLFTQALALEPGNPSTLTSLAIHYRRLGRNRDAVLACDQAIRSYPGYPDAWLERGAILAAGGSNAAAKASFAEAARLAPHLAAAHAGLASLAAREGDSMTAQRHAADALRLDPAHPVAINALASAQISAGDTEQAIARLEPQAERLGTPSLERSITRSLLGDAYHRRRDHDAAFAHYAAANADFAALYARDATGHPDHHSFVEALISGLAASAPDAWAAGPAPQPDNAAKRHIFLIGYPRSGTTLVENILASLPGVHALEERPTLGAADRAFIHGDAAQVTEGIARFAALDAAGLDQYRQAYWANVTSSAVPAAAAAFVDMDPLKGTRLPFIARLFPQARILIMRRDPRDVVWSCFRTNFAMTSGTLQYTTLEDTARHYDALMRLTELALARLPLATHQVWYHRLVQDFDSETQAMCAFAGLEWSAAVRDFDRTAVQRGVTTASVGQVSRGLYDGTGQWQPYAKYLEPVLPILQPWIDKFGYDR